MLEETIGSSREFHKLTVATKVAKVTMATKAAKVTM